MPTLIAALRETLKFRQQEAHFEMSCLLKELLLHYPHQEFAWLSLNIYKHEPIS